MLIVFKISLDKRDLAIIPFYEINILPRKSSQWISMSILKIIVLVSNTRIPYLFDYLIFTEEYKNIF